MTTWKLTLEYDGTKYSGWQEQRNARTIAGELRTAAQAVLGGDVELQGAGRTDAGVHALGQVAHIRTDARSPQAPEFLRRAFNEKLPSDIVVLSVEKASNRFHARHDALLRSYVYQISTRKSAFAKRHVWWVKEALDVTAMASATKMIAGRHDFICFRAADASKLDESTIVVVDRASVEAEDDLIVFRIEASHFLWRMVRRLVGVLVKLGKGDIQQGHFEKLLAGKCDSQLDVAAWTAPSSGLFLERVEYATDKAGR